MKRLLYDIETCPCIAYIWNPGRKIYVPWDNVTRHSEIVCICYQWSGEKKIRSLQWDYDAKDRDEKMVREFVDILISADESVAHFGDGFDLPWIRGRCLYYDIEFPPSLVTLDTCKMLSGIRVESKKLDALGERLSLGRKKETNFGLWKLVMAGDKAALRYMVRYCKGDVAVLAKLFWRLSKQRYGKVGPVGEAWTCRFPECGSDDVGCSRSYRVICGRWHHAMRCRACGRYYTISHTAYQKFRDVK